MFESFHVVDSGNDGISQLVVTIANDSSELIISESHSTNELVHIVD